MKLFADVAWYRGMLVTLAENAHLARPVAISLARTVWTNASMYEISPAQLDCDDALVTLELAKEGQYGSLVYRTDTGWTREVDPPHVPIKIKIDDPKTRAIWASVQRAKAEVASWPAWKRGEDGPCDEK